MAKKKDEETHEVEVELNRSQQRVKEIFEPLLGHEKTEYLTVGKLEEVLLKLAADESE